MNELQIFENPQFGKVRTLEENGAVLFCGSDVARALGYSNPRDAIARHCKGVVKRDGVSQTTNQHGTTTAQTTEMSFIPESDLYRLAFGSKLPAAEKFTDWVTVEVLPMIRKHGVYATAETAERLLNDPDFMIKTFTALKEERDRSHRMMERAALLTAELDSQQYKVEYFDALVEKNMLTSLRETAKLYNLGERDLIFWLVRHKYLYRGKGGKLLPAADKAPAGLFAVKEVFDKDRNWAGVQTFVTPKGRETFRLLIGKCMESAARFIEEATRTT